MPKTALFTSLKNLHAALGQHPDLSADDRAMLRTVLADIQGALDDDKPHPPEAVVRDAGNPTHQAVVWYVRRGADDYFIRCFVPGDDV